jgi:CTP:molybdopterin cytidylyltransferase MocA
MDRTELTLVILAAGHGTRFGGPKQLAPAGPSGEPLMDYTVFDSLLAGFRRVVFVTSESVRTATENHVTGRYGPVDVRVTVQPPRGDGVWGTGHAVLSAASSIDGDFAVCNADDYYGREALVSLADHLRAQRQDSVPTHALVGYRLDATLGDRGGVSRALLELEGASITGVVEARELVTTERGIVGELVDGTPVRVEPDRLVSMNLWGFRRDVLDHLARQFATHSETGSGEFYLSNAVGEQVQSGLCDLRCITSPSQWFGMTYAADMTEVRARLAGLVNGGLYPGDLAGTFAGSA